ncbi:MAG: hypothetical protein AB7I25_00370 [Vicinamibacterales bacterium]
MPTSRTNRALIALFSTMGFAAFYLIPPGLLERVVSSVCSGLVIVFTTIEIRRDRERGPYADERPSLGLRG